MQREKKSIDRSSRKNNQQQQEKDRHRRLNFLAGRNNIKVSTKTKNNRNISINNNIKIKTWICEKTQPVQTFKHRFQYQKTKNTNVHIYM